MSHSTDRRYVVEADGGSRGNPGPAGYGTVVRDGLDGQPLAERAEAIGRATNNVAEYSGLIAGLRAAAELGARAVDVRMDSKLVVEQMSGRWRVKHPDLKPLALTAAALVRDFDEVTFTWIPRARNAHADRLANEAMDHAARGEVWTETGSTAAQDIPALEPLELRRPIRCRPDRRRRCCWCGTARPSSPAPAGGPAGATSR